MHRSNLLVGRATERATIDAIPGDLENANEYVEQYEISIAGEPEVCRPTWHTSP
jgi:hypothetical protein